MRYAVPETVYRLLEIDPLEADPQELLDLENVEEGVAANIDAKCGRTFGAAAVPATRTIGRHRDQGFDFYTDRVFFPDGNIYFFPQGYWGLDLPYVSPIGFRNVTAISHGGTWDGSVYADEEPLVIADWELLFTNRHGWSHGISTAAFYGPIRITAEWEDRPHSLTVPPDIREAANFITVDEWRVNHQSPAGEIGPPGLATFLRNAWEFDKVKTAIANHKYRQIVV